MIAVFFVTSKQRWYKVARVLLGWSCYYLVIIYATARLFPNGVVRFTVWGVRTHLPPLIALQNLSTNPIVTLTKRVGLQPEDSFRGAGQRLIDSEYVDPPMETSSERVIIAPPFFQETAEFGFGDHDEPIVCLSTKTGALTGRQPF